MPARTTFWTVERDTVLRETVLAAHPTGLRIPGAFWSQLGQRLGTSAEGCRIRWQAMRDGRAQVQPDLPPRPDPPPPETPEQRAERVRDARLEREALQAVAGEKSLRAFLERLVRTAAHDFEPPARARPVKPSAKATRESVIQPISDLHAYELVSRARTRGFNEYTAEIMGARMRRLVETHLSIKDRMERGGGWAFERLVVACNGDLVSGTIHELERHADAPNIVQAVYGAGMLLAYVIRDLAAAYPEVEVFCTSGNHGRLPDARRMQQKDPTRNWDTLVCLFAREHLRRLGHVRWYIPDSYSVAYDVYGWRFLQTHGHDVKSWNAIPWYGLNRLVGNVNALEAARGTPIHYYLFSHFHSQSALEHAAGESFINGSVIGPNEFVINALGKADRPTQLMLCVHPEHGVTSRWPIRLDGAPDGEPYPVRPWEQAA